MKEAQLIPAKPLLFQCPLCKEMTRLKDFHTSPEGLEVRCAECKGIFFCARPTHSSLTQQNVPSTPAARSAPSQELSATQSKDTKPPLSSTTQRKPDLTKSDLTTSLERTKTCPKCGHQNPQSRDSCIKCGLDFTKADKLSFSTTLHSDPKVSQKAEELWQEVLQDWDNPQMHERFMTLCSAYGMYQAAGRLYREQQETRPNDPMASRQLEKLVDVAHVQMIQQFKETKSKRSLGGGFKLAIAAFLVLGGGLVVFLFMRVINSMLKSIP